MTQSNTTFVLDYTFMPINHGGVPGDYISNTVLDLLALKSLIPHHLAFAKKKRPAKAPSQQVASTLEVTEIPPVHQEE